MKKDTLVEELTIVLRNDKSVDLTEIIHAMRDLEIRDRDGRTLLINASFYNCADVVELLIQRGADVNARDNAGNTPLHAATQEGNINIMRILLENGAEVNCKNNFGNTPIWITQPLQPKEVFYTLLSYGADPEIKNNFGVSAMDCMIAYPEIIEIFTTRNLNHRHIENE